MHERDRILSKLRLARTYRHECIGIAYRGK